MAQAKKVDRSIEALGARRDTQSEKAFRNALAGIPEGEFRGAGEIAGGSKRDIASTL